MARQNLPNNTKLEDLLKALESKDEDPKADWIQEFHHTEDVTPFLSFYNIKPGNELVQSKILYKLYKTWSKDPLRETQFNWKIKDYIEYKEGYLKLNIDALQVSNKVIDYLKEHTQNKTKSPSWKRHFDNFLTYYNIESGDNWVESYYLYHIYDLWTYKNKVKSWLGYKQFINFCDIYFKQKRRTSSKIKWFAISIDIRTLLTKETMENIKQSYAQKKST